MTKKCVQPRSDAHQCDAGSATDRQQATSNAENDAKEEQKCIPLSRADCFKNVVGRFAIDSGLA
jgi:hypothetical protein